MMTYTELKAGLNAALQTIFPMVSDDPKVQTYAYYGLEVVEGYDQPCFFTRLETGDTRISNKNLLYHNLIFSITYIPAETDEIDMMAKLDAIRDLFALGCFIQTGSERRYVDCTDFDWDFGGSERDVLEISVELEYLTDIRPPETAETMRDATVRLIGGTDHEWYA